MKSVYLVVLLAAAATAAVVSNEVPDVADVDVNELPEVVGPDVDEKANAAEMLAQPASVPIPYQSWGSRGIGDRTLYHQLHSAQLTPFNRDITISVVGRINYMVVTPTYHHIVSFSVISGGLGTNRVTFRVTLPVNGSYRVNIEIAGR